MIWLIVAAVVIGLLLLALFSDYMHERGYEAGRREQQRIVNRATDELRRQGAEAQRGIDYLYEQASEQIRQQGSEE